MVARRQDQCQTLLSLIRPAARVMKTKLPTLGPIWLETSLSAQLACYVQVQSALAILLTAAKDPHKQSFSFRCAIKRHDTHGLTDVNDVFNATTVDEVLI